MRLELVNLDCSHCASLIEEEINKLDNINQANLNFINKSLNLELASGANEKKVLEEINNIIKKIEPDVYIKQEDKVLKFELVNLDCSHCASLIEEELNNQDSINQANLNFINKSLSLELASGANEKKVLEEVTNIIKKIEPDVYIKQENKSLGKNDDKKENKDLARIIAGGTIFLISLILKFDLGFLIAYIILGYDIIYKSLRNILKGKIFDENFLMALATVGAIIIKQYSEAVAIMFLYQLGEYFQRRAVGKSRNAIKELLNLKPEYATLEDGSVVYPENIEKGEIIVVKTGEKIALDGEIISGDAFLDMSALIGESVPRKVSKGDLVLSGSINTNGVLKIKTTTEYKNSTVAKILDLVENSSMQKSKTENFISKFAKVYTPVVVFIALFLAICMPILMGHNFSFWLQKSLVFLVSSCPCALVISVPLSFFSGLGYASKKGILIKGSTYIQNLSNIDAIIFDKTGTLTKGVFEVNYIDVEEDKKEQVLNYLYNIEKYSIHPIAKSIVKYCSDNYNPYDLEVEDFKEISGLGISAKIGDDKIFVGNEKLMLNNDIQIRNTDKNGSVVHIAKNKKYLGYLVVSDVIKENAKALINKLDTKTVMLSGDKKENAIFVANKIGIDKVYWELLPQDKVEKFKEIKNEYNTVCFVGDGINDAPILSIADVGISMGSIGSDIAIEASDVVLMNDDLDKIYEAIRISKKTMFTVRFNVIMALSIKFAVLIWAIFGNAPIWVAVFADVGVSLIAILNAMKKK